MSTRSCIAKPCSDKSKGSWEGVYHHSDGYPSGMGATVWNLVQNRYKGDLEQFYFEIIDNNLDGWSQMHCFHPEWGNGKAITKWDGKTISGVDEPYVRMSEGERYAIPCSYKGDPLRSDGATECDIYEKASGALHIEWVYIVEEDGLRILSSQPCARSDKGAVNYGHCIYRHVEQAFVPWTADEPDWEAFEKYDEGEYDKLHARMERSVAKNIHQGIFEINFGWQKGFPSSNIYSLESEGYKPNKYTKEEIEKALGDVIWAKQYELMKEAMSQIETQKLAEKAQAKKEAEHTIG